MKHVVNVGCDGARVCFFDAAALPKDFDTQCAEDPVGLMESLEAEQRFWAHETGGDGSYIFHVVVDQDPPATFSQRGKLVQTFERFAVPSGRLWFCGAEYAANDPATGSRFTPSGGLGRFSSMGAAIELLPGTYRIGVFTLKWSESQREAVVRKAIPKAQLQKARRNDAIGTAFLAAGGLVLVISMIGIAVPVGIGAFQFFAHDQPAARLGYVLKLWGVVAACGAVLGSIGYWLTRFIVSPETRQKLESIRQELPDYLLVAQRNG